MRLKKETVRELKQILEEEFDFIINSEDLEDLAYSLVNYFSLLLKINSRKFGNCPSSHIAKLQNGDNNLLR